MPHHEGEQPPHGLVSSLIVEYGKGEKTRPNVGRAQNGGLSHAQCVDMLAHSGWEYGKHLGKEVDRLGRVLPKRARTVVGVFRRLEMLCREGLVSSWQCSWAKQFRGDDIEALPEGAF